MGRFLKTIASGLATLGMSHVVLSADPAWSAGEGVISEPAVSMATTFSLLFGVVSVLVAIGSLFLARRSRNEASKASSDLDIVAQRLVRLEHHLTKQDLQDPKSSQVEGAHSKSALEKSPAIAQEASVAASPAELTVEIGLLGGLVKDIAETVGAHDRILDLLAGEIGALRRRVESELSAKVQHELTAHHSTVLAPPRPAPIISGSVSSDPAPTAAHPQAAENATIVLRPPSLNVAAVSNQSLLQTPETVKVPNPVQPSASSGPAVVAPKPNMSNPVIKNPHTDVQPKRATDQILQSVRREPVFDQKPTPSSDLQKDHTQNSNTMPAQAALAAEVYPIEAQTRRGVASTAQLQNDARDDARDGAIVAAAAAGLIELHLQPIVALPQRKIRFYESLSRLKLDDGSVLSPAEFLPVLERRGLVARFDEEAIARVIQVARHLSTRDASSAVSFNLAAASVSEPGYLRGLDRVFAAWPDVAERIILEVPQRLLRTMDVDRLSLLSSIARRGVKLCIDRVGDLRIDPMALAERGVVYFKAPARLLLGADATRADIHVEDLAAMLARAGISLIAEHVEHEDTVRELLDLDVPLAQGFLFAPPRPVRADVLAAISSAPKDPPPSQADLSPKGDDGSLARKPFRDFLRRA